MADNTFARKSKFRIVVVENEPMLRIVVEDLLSRLDHTIVGWASTASGAVREAESTKPDVILMDIELNGPVDGIEAAERIRRRLGIPSLFMTGSTDVETRRRAQTVGPVGFLHKPLIERELRASLERLAAG